MIRNFQFLEHRFKFPVTNDPEWSAKVDRWYQLDAYAYGLCAAYTEWQKSSGLVSPAMIVLASSRASNETDLQFVQSGARSPAKFSHTLANVRSSPLCQVMEWSGVVLCLQKDPHTFLAGLSEARFFEKGVWVLGVDKILDHEYSAKVAVFDSKKSAFKLQFDSHRKNRAPTPPAVSPDVNDSTLFEWLRSPSEIFYYSDFEVLKNVP